MVSVKKFEDLLVWQETRKSNKEIYVLFSNLRDYGFRDQIQRASVSVMNNIAEGFERDGDREFQRFLKIAKGSAGEVRSMLYVAEDLNYLSSKEGESLREKFLSISKKLSKLIQYLNRKDC